MTHFTRINRAGIAQWCSAGLQAASSGVRDPALGPTHPPIQWISWALSLEVKRPRREADDSPPSSAEVSNAWSYTSTSNAPS
jgi:hypothetical protein